MEENERRLVHLLLDKALDVSDQTRHYVAVEFSNYGNPVCIRVQEGGFDQSEDYSLVEDFRSGKIVGSIRFQRTLDYLDSLLPQACVS